jgi:endonuclease-8
MPEGDTIFRVARTLHRALAGRVIVRFESALPSLTRIDADRPLAGRTIESVRSQGKHVLMTLSGDLVLHTHMRMNGSWHLYRPGERWQRPARDMRIVIATADIIAVGFNVPVAELLSHRQMEHHEALRRLGPDLAAGHFDREEVLRRVRERRREPIGDLLLDQRVLSGIGNVLKSEILFLSGIDPFTPADAIADDDLQRVLDVALNLMRLNVLDPNQSMGRAAGRRTTGSLDPSRKLWVYGRGGKRCLKCGTPIQARKTGLEARLTYWCPSCQASHETTQAR